MVTEWFQCKQPLLYCIVISLGAVCHVPWAFVHVLLKRPWPLGIIQWFMTGGHGPLRRVPIT